MCPFASSYAFTTEKGDAALTNVDSPADLHVGRRRIIAGTRTWRCDSGIVSRAATLRARVDRLVICRGHALFETSNDRYFIPIGRSPGRPHWYIAQFS